MIHALPGILAGLLLLLGLIDAVMRYHDQKNAPLRQAFTDIDSRGY